MKLPSSPVIVYSVIYSILFLQATIFHFILLPYISSSLYRVYLIDFYVTCILYLIGNYIFFSNNIYDIHWPLIPLICSIYFHFTTNTIEFFSFQRLLLIILIFTWSFHLINQTLCSSNNVRHEDWRYQMMRKQYDNYFLLFAFFALHLLPMFEVLIGSSSIYYIYMNTLVDQNTTIVDILLLLIIFSGVLLENLADKQLTEFRRNRKNSREHKYAVLSTGLWKYSRHPNYLGEMIFWWGLFFLGYTHNAPLWCALGPLLVTLMMIFGSIPMNEERMFRTYPDYKFVQQHVSMLIPTFGFF